MTIENIKNLVSEKELGYGSVVSEKELCDWFGIEMPDLSGRKHTEITDAVHKYDMEKLNAYGSINKYLLSVGMCFVQEKSTFRVPAINEMQSHINKYYRASETKFKSAEKLRKSFSNLHPIEAKEVNDKMSRTASMRDSENKRYSPMN